jgi:hypothetical protein
MQHEQPPMNECAMALSVMDGAPGTVLVSPVRVERKDKLGQRSMVLALLAAVVVLDQAIKWWAWRHASTARINYGGNALVGTTIDRWYADPLMR